MEFLFAIPVVLLPFVMPLITGVMAKSMGRKFWPWFFLGIPLPFVANVILLCLPVKKVVSVEPVANEEIFDILFIDRSKKIKRINHEQHLSA